LIARGQVAASACNVWAFSRGCAKRGATLARAPYRTRDADRILVLHEGRLIEDGTHTDLMALNGHYAELYRLQAAGYK